MVNTREEIPQHEVAVLWWLMKTEYPLAEAAPGEVPATSSGCVRVFVAGAVTHVGLVAVKSRSFSSFAKIFMHFRDVKHVVLDFS